MSGQKIRKQAAGRLLLGGTQSTRIQVQDRGITWYRDPYGFARAELFKRPPAATRLYSASLMRQVLDRVRGETVIGFAEQTRHTVSVGGNPGILVGTAALVAAVNPDLWAGWAATGLTPKFTARGTVLWFGKVRGKDALFGGFLPLWLGPLTASTGDPL